MIGPDSAFFRRNYFADGDQSNMPSRYDTLVRWFREKYGDCSVKLARAPGRVNLIGEHTDYNGCPVLPMAVNRDVVAAFAPMPESRVEISNVEDGVFADRSFAVRHSIPPFATGDWGNYIKAGVQGVVDFLGREHSGALRGVRMVVWGNIPRAAGMSSSSALVVLSALVFMEVNSINIANIDLAPLLAKAEWYVGTQGGGMDQAISLLGRAGQALKIDFNPFAVHAVTVPTGYVFVVANSMVQASKTKGAMDKYNRRSIECRFATAVLRHGFACELGRTVKLDLIGDLTAGELGADRPSVRAMAHTILGDRTFSLARLADVLGQSQAEVQESYCRRKDGAFFPEPADGFQLERRCRHVLSEWDRVEESLGALQSGSMRRFGELMNASHASCRDDFEISCPELDRLAAIGAESEALGSRLTGAGFGGCTVNLLEEQKVGRFIEKLISKYYKSYLGLGEEHYSSIVFACKPVDGAGIVSC